MTRCIRSLTFVLALVACGLALAQIEGQETRSVEIAGTLVEYEYVVPDGFTPSSTYPVLIVLPPGEGGATMANMVLGDWFRDEGRARGWVVVSPLAPRDPVLLLRFPYYLGSETLIPPLLDHLAGELTFEGGQALLAGVSAGGV